MKTIFENAMYTVNVMAGRPPTKEAPPFGQRMATLRQERGMSQTELAERLNMSRAMVTYYERKATNPTADVIQRIADALGVGVDALLVDANGGRSRQRPGPASQFEQQLAEVRRLPRNKQKFVVDFLDTFLQREAKSAH